MIAGAAVAVGLTVLDLWLTWECLRYPRAYERVRFFRDLGFRGSVALSAIVLAAVWMLAETMAVPAWWWAYSIGRAGVVVANAKSLRELRRGLG